MFKILTSWSVRLNLLALTAIATAVTSVAPVVTYALAFAVFGTVVWRYRRSVVAIRFGRTLAALAVLIEIWNADGGDRWLLLGVGIPLTMYLAYANLVRRALNIAYLESVNLDVSRGRWERLSMPPAVGLVMNILVALFAPTAAVPEGGARTATDIVFAVLVLGGFALIVLAVAENYMRRQGESHPVDTAVVAAVHALRPKFVVHFAGAPRSEYQIKMWLPYFDMVGDPYVVLVRDRYLLKGTAAATTAPIVVVPNQTVLDKLLPDSVRACFYSNQAMKNASLIRHGELLHVQLMHGDSDKAISRTALSLMYDRVFVAGQAGVDRYHRHGVDIPNYKFRKVGRPQLSTIAVGARQRAATERRAVLYTPTWTGFTEDVNYSSLQQGKRIVSALLRRDVTVIFRTHPYTKTNAAYLGLANDIKAMIAADAAATGRPHLWAEPAEVDLTLADCINAADVAISDISGTASDWLYCGRPFAMTDPKGFGPGYLEEFPLARGAYLLDAEAGNVEWVLDELLERDSKSEVRAEVREYYLGDIAPEDLIGVFVSEVRATYAHPVRKTATGGSAIFGDRVDFDSTAGGGLALPVS